jgi:arsenite methyltransferase
MRKTPTVAACLCALLMQRAGPYAQTKPMTMEEMHKLHQDSQAYIAMLEDPARDREQKPHEVIMALGLKEGERIADIGAGAGYFTLRFAQHVGGSGLVYAVDISPDMILHLNERIRGAGLNNVRTILAKTDDPLLADRSVDVVFICNTWHHIPGHPQYLGLLKKVLKPGGRVVDIDYQKKPMAVGPPMEMRIAREDVVREFEQNGFRLAKEHTFLPSQYFLVFTPAAAGGRPRDPADSPIY